MLQSLRSTDVIHQLTHGDSEFALDTYYISGHSISQRLHRSNLSLVEMSKYGRTHTPAPSSFLPPACVPHLPLCFPHRPVFLSASASNLPVFIATAYIGLLCFSLSLSAFQTCVSESCVYFCHWPVCFSLPVFSPRPRSALLSCGLTWK